MLLFFPFCNFLRIFSQSKKNKKQKKTCIVSFSSALFLSVIKHVECLIFADMFLFYVSMFKVWQRYSNKVNFCNLT